MLRLATVLALLLLAAPALALKPEVGYRVTPLDYGIVFDTLTIRTRDGLALRGWFFPAQDTAGIANELVGRMIPVPPELRRMPRPYAGAGRRATVILCDGDAGNMQYAIYYAYELFTRGFNVVTFDWRGFGESAPWPAPTDQLVCAEYLTDYDAAIRHVVARSEVDPARIGLMGFSTGAYLSFAAAATHPEIAALVARAVPSSFDDLLPVVAPLDTSRHWAVPASYPRELLPAAVAPGLTAAVLLIVGEKDVRTPPWMSEKVFARLGGPKELWIVPGAGHGGAAAPEAVAGEEFWKRSREFLERHMGRARR